jgi:hypothetical protein
MRPLLNESIPNTPVPEMNNGGRWHHIGSEQEIRNAMRDKNAEVIEIPAISMTYVVSYERLVIVRAAALGGDVNNIEGGWVYANDLALRLDVRELRSLAESMRKAGIV